MQILGVLKEKVRTLSRPYLYSREPKTQHNISLRIRILNHVANEDKIHKNTILSVRSLSKLLCENWTVSNCFVGSSRYHS